MMKKGSKLYVRIDSRNEGKDTTNKDFEEHMTFVNNLAKERYLVGGGFSCVDGGMILLEAKSIEEAREILRKDPVIEKGFYKFELYEWDLAVLSDDIEA